MVYTIKSGIKAFSCMISLFIAVVSLIYFLLSLKDVIAYANPPFILILESILLLIVCILMLNYVTISYLRYLSGKINAMIFLSGLTALMFFYIIYIETAKHLFQRNEDFVRFSAYLTDETLFFIFSAMILVSFIPFIYQKLRKIPTNAHFQKVWRFIKNKVKKPNFNKIRTVLRTESKKEIKSGENGSNKVRSFLHISEPPPKPDKIDYLILSKVYENFNRIEKIQEVLPISNKEITNSIEILEQNNLIENENGEYKLTKKGFEIIHKKVAYEKSSKPKKPKNVSKPSQLTFALNTIALFLIFTSFLFPVFGNSLLGEINLVQLIGNNGINQILFFLALLLAILGYVFPSSNLFAGMLFFVFVGINVILISSNPPGLVSSYLPIEITDIYNKGFYSLLGGSLILLISTFSQKIEKQITD
ncbi:MAG: hypothetical protein R6U44_01560 [Archaeoglobaceae archaeon]